MAKQCLLFLLLISIGHTYSPKNMDLSKYEFSRYVRPQLKSILTEYSSLFISLNEHLTPFKESLTFYRDISRYLEKINDQCPIIDNETCKNHLQELNEELKKHIVFTEKVEFTPSSNLTLNKYIEGLDLFEDYKLKLLNTYLKIDSHLVEYQIKGKSTLSGKTVVNWATQLEFSVNMFLLSQVDTRFENTLTSFWIDFIRPVYQIILAKNDIKFFKVNLTNLNIRWNELHVILTKKNIIVSKHANTLMNIMHNRWNNILKVTLKPY